MWNILRNDVDFLEISENVAIRIKILWKVHQMCNEIIQMKKYLKKW